MANDALRAIVYARGRLELLDQRKLPHETTYLPANDHKACWTLIREMAVRGAPAIAVSAALSVAVELANGTASFASAGDVRTFVEGALDHLYTSRPTAVNLGEACARLRKTVAAAAEAPGATASDVAEAVIADAEAYQREDLSSCHAIGDHGADALMAAVAERRGGAAPAKLRVMTICNTGSLATAGHGTALGVVRSLHARGQLAKCVALETRPWLQGARLTAYELAHDNLPRTLIADSAAAFLMARGEVDACVVGADRIARNGDTANKIGTFALAIAAARHNVPFFVAAPATTVDLSMPNGRNITIEERGSEELTHVRGTAVAAANVPTWNPVFDVTPSDLIAGVITDHGVAWNADGSVDVAGLLGDKDASSSTPAIALPVGYRDLDEEGVKAYIATHPRLAALLKEAPQSTWECREVGDGNINFVYIVEAPGCDGVVVKQARPYVRCVGESWPLTLNRMRREASALRAEFAVCPQHTPEVFVYDEAMSVMAMQYLKPPHTIARKLLYSGQTPRFFGPHVAEFLAATLFHTSRLASDGDEAFRKAVMSNANTEMCALTEQVIFTEPYIVASNNRWTTPQLDADAAALREDAALHAGIAALKRKFVESTEALLHGDLHTGSFMLDVDGGTTYAIDPEFAFYGPMGFDIGAVLSNLLICYFSQDGWQTATGEDRGASRAFLLETAKAVWDGFAARFLELWNAREAKRVAAGEAFLPATEGFKAAYMRGLRADALGFTGAKMVRRIVGIAHNADLEEISDPDVRSACERRVLALGKRLVTDARAVVPDTDGSGIDALLAAAAAVREGV